MIWQVSPGPDLFCRTVLLLSRAGSPTEERARVIRVFCRSCMAPERRPPVSNFGYTRAPGPECIGPGARVSPECIGPVLSIFWARAASDGALLRRSRGPKIYAASVVRATEISAVCAPEMRPPVSNLANNQYFICACSDLGQQLPALEAWYLMVTGAQGVCGLSSTLGPE